MKLNKLLGNYGWNGRPAMGTLTAPPEEDAEALAYFARVLKQQREEHEAIKTHSQNEENKKALLSGDMQGFSDHSLLSSETADCGLVR